MVDNKFITCSTCGTTINLRIQLGYFNIPFHVNCPNCDILINGKVILEDAENYYIKLDNACEIDEYENEFYSVELSAEFPTRKIKKKTMGLDNVELSPFIRAHNFYNDILLSKNSTKNAMFFSNYYKKHWSDLKINYNLFWNNQLRLLKPKINKELSKYPHIGVTEVRNMLDACMALHQMLIATTGISVIVGDNSISRYISLANLMLEDKSKLPKYMEYSIKIESKLDNIEKKAFKLIESFAKIYDQLIPVVSLRYADKMNNVDMDKYGIMTANFEELTTFYAQSYEWILENVDIVIALNNIEVRGDYQKCENGKSYDEYLKVFKGKKLEWMNNDEPFSIPVISLKNKLRNAIQHFDSEIDYTTQIIKFHDRENVEKLYLMEFASLCIDNFSVVIYILELVYNLRRNNLFLSGCIPHLNVKTNIGSKHSVKKKKIGRNAPCYCGSGKKYKKCCLNS
ncbi:YecA family protein [Enterococcus faecalis]|uniref:YecA family protein n=1 Tax=Enterococcus faecalis TaxID=1351 RepID=UPI0018E759EF|nr:SEC-C metal-binding domain-containing protein [Enterococcus faecalis]MBJ0351379.1 SEC-C domain-containing protein [Enterococcus faecalis]